MLLALQTPYPKQEKEEDTNKQWLRKKDKKLKKKVQRCFIFIFFRSVEFLPAVECGSFLNVILVSVILFILD